MAAVAALAGRFGLPPRAAEQLAELARLLEHDPEAPTTVTARQAVLDDHLADSLVALDLEEVRSARLIADLGSGAGLPALPLAIALPAASVTLVESNARKCGFLQRAISGCGIENARVFCGRAEALDESRDSFDVVTARAVARLGVVAEYAAPLLRHGGHLVAWRGKREPEVEAEAAWAAEILGLSVRDPLPVKPYSAAEHRFLHVMSKVSATPQRFPRRPGVARKRPLGAVGPTGPGREPASDRRAR